MRSVRGIPWTGSPCDHRVALRSTSHSPTAAATSGWWRDAFDLDYALLKQARKAGADIRDGHSFESIHMHAEFAELTAVGLPPIRARYVVAADGMWSPTRKALGLAPNDYLGDWHAFRQYYRDVSGAAATRMFVWFEPEILPGYAWSFPLPDGGANVGFGIVRDGTRPTGEMRQLWPTLLTTPHIRDALGTSATPESPHRAWPIPARIDKMALAAPRVLLRR